MKSCLICGRLITKQGKYYDLGIGSTCYEKFKPKLTAKYLSNAFKNNYSRRIKDKDLSLYNLPLFEGIKNERED